MDTPHSSTLRRPLRALCALGLSLAAMAACASSAGAYVSPAQAEHAADRGANWFQANQEASGSLGADWAMTALAAAGINSADVRTSLVDPSAQDFYLDEWQAEGPGGAGTDAARGILTGVAGGIQPSRLSTATETKKSNLVARIAELFDGTQIGDPGLLNDDIFGVLALHQVGAPAELLRRIVDYLRTKQLADGGWSWNSAPNAIADTDMTGSVIASFCAAGVSPGDPDLDQAIALIHSLQDPDTGGFIAPPEAFGIGVNSDTTSWVVSGLIQCGIDPQGSEWTTTQGKTPLDYLLSLQRPDGHFDWTADFPGGAFETYSAVRPLGGVGFSSEPPARLDGVSPAVRPAQTVADGTPVPITLVIDHGPGVDDVRMCRVDIESGSNLEAVLTNALDDSTPAGCVSGFQASSTGAGVRLASLDGVAETAGYEWRSQVDGSTPQATQSKPIGFGDLVFLKFRPKVADPAVPPRVDVPPLSGTKRKKKAHSARVAVRGKAQWHDANVAVRLECPRGIGVAGCRGSLTIQFRRHRAGRLILGGSTAFRVGSGQTRTVAIPSTRALRHELGNRQKLKLRITAATDTEGAKRLTRVRRFLAG